MFNYLTTIHFNFKAGHRRNVSCRDQVLKAIIVDTASSHVTAEGVRLALQDAVPEGQYVHQHLGRLDANSRTSSLEITDRYALGPGVDDVSAIIVARRVSIADTPWWGVDTRSGQSYHSSAAVEPLGFLHDPVTPIGTGTVSMSLYCSTRPPWTAGLAIPTFGCLTIDLVS